jgi:predicted amidohydrolase
MLEEPMPIEPTGVLLALAGCTSPVAPTATSNPIGSVKKSRRAITERARAGRGSVPATTATTTTIALGARLSIFIGRSIGALRSAIIGASGECAKQSDHEG